ncbi:PREDICTED: uncharacterized protein LOC106919246 [Poecilia mexicana]|uniref:uncharacterized protein LOC106919246 n=1 Tax=Poecilia mexicana TaxID=48701 RepID=UPI00072E9BFD|nr:PREDICTED: uncharacterized protein LOC106919246 [Poecilia mexicana]
MLRLVLLLLLGGTHATHFLGTMMTYYPKQTHADGSVTVSLRYKLGFTSCYHSDIWSCLSSCGSLNPTLQEVDMEPSGEWCQREGTMTTVIFPSYLTQLVFAGGNWIDYIQNNVVSWRAETFVELGIRSDTRKPNASPQSTIMPAVRVPSNCQRDYDLMAFDPDGDNVECRFGSDSLYECDPCAPPSILNISSSCTLSFNRTNSTNEGPYAVQLVLEDFPKQTITLTNVYGAQTTKTTSQAISKIPLQFVLRVDPVVPSCTEGLFLPKFLPPTPANRAKMSTRVNQPLEISIAAEAANATISELLFSGPATVVKTSSGSGNFTLRWTPSVSEEGESHPICFVVQATLNSEKYHSELRCVIVQVELGTVVRVNMKVLSSLSQGGIVNEVVLQKIKDELVSLGLPSNSSLLVLKSSSALANATATSGV